MLKLQKFKTLLGWALESIDLIEQYLKGKNKNYFFTDKLLQDSVLRRLEILGIVVESISREIPRGFSIISGKKITGMKDKLIREYWNVDLDLVWEVIQKDIPDLKKKILKVQAQLEKEK